MPPSIADFLDRYRAAFDALDGEAVARLYAVPSGIAHEGGYTHWATFDAVRDNMAALCRQYRAGGYLAAAFEVGTCLPQGERFAVVDLAWTINRSEGRPPWRFRTGYHLMRDDEGWRVLLCTAYDEAKLPPPPAA